MNVSIGERWEGFVASVVDQGRYGSASEVVREGLRLVEEREAKLAALRETLDVLDCAWRQPYCRGSERGGQGAARPDFFRRLMQFCASPATRSTILPRLPE